MMAGRHFSAGGGAGLRCGAGEPTFEVVVCLWLQRHLMDTIEHPGTSASTDAIEGVEDGSRHGRGSGEVGGVRVEKYHERGGRRRDMTIAVNLLCASSIVTCKTVYIFLEQIYKPENIQIIILIIIFFRTTAFLYYFN